MKLHYTLAACLIFILSSCGQAPTQPSMTTNTYCLCPYNGDTVAIGDANCMINGLEQSCACVINSGTNQQESLTCKLGVVSK